MLSRWSLLCLCSSLFGGASASPEQKVLDISSKESLSAGSDLDSTTRTGDDCRKLQSRFPRLVSFPGDAVYEDEQRSYWSTTQAFARPACRLTPSNTHETSQLIQYLSEHEIDIAVVSGGHSTTVGATNLDSGVTLDLSALSSITIASDKSSVIFGPGTRWLQIYEHLDPHGLTVAGARAGSVGAAGFLLGGGISILAPSRGWSCDTLLSIEVILGNGTTVNANATYNRDLFYSMQGHGANFGVATSFTMSVFPVEQLQSSVISYQGEQFAHLAHQITEIAKHSHRDQNAAMDLSVIADPSGTYLTGFVMATRFGKIEESETLKPFYSIPHGTGYINNVRPQDIAAAVDVSNPRGFRHSRSTITIRNDEVTLLTMFAAIEREFLRKDLPGEGAYLPAMLVQPIYKTQLGRRNSLGLHDETEPLLLISLEATWLLPKHDTIIPQHLTALRLILTQIAEKHDTLHPFVYPNYAGEDQDVFAAIKEGHKGEKIMEVLRNVQERYDPSGYIARRVTGASKL